MELPKGIVANTLNRRHRRMERMVMTDDAIPRMHVSSLIKSTPQDRFCEREFVLRYMEREDPAGAGVPPKFELLYATGHFLGDYIVNQFLKRNQQWGKYAWGDWGCMCGKSKRIRQLKPKKARCRHCRGKLDRYLETDLTNTSCTVVGHADLILCVDGYYYVYEFKSIDRSDIDFTTLKEPLADHVMQASNYYYMLKAEGKKVSSQIRFVYVDRSMAGLYREKPYKEFEAPKVTLRRLRMIYDRAAKVHTSIEKGVLPERICESIKCSRAKQCSKAISCFSRRKETIKRIPLMV